jgi:sugar-specific transcriptional regulator TrmB/DNA-binding CsgD family transcriptional regulator
MVKHPGPEKLDLALRVLGIEEDEERAYHFLLMQHTATAEEVAARLSLPIRRTQALLQRVEAKGLASHSPEQPRRYIPARPELAIEALIQQRQATLERTRSAIPHLKSLMANGPVVPVPLDLVEVITSRPALGQILEQLQDTVQSEVFAFQRAPTLYPDGHQKTVKEHIRIRSISDSTYLDMPGSLESLRRVTSMGEEARYSHTLPMKMIVWDRRIAIVPLSVDNQQGPALLVRGSSLLDALCALFDLTWERSTPLAFNLSGALEEQRSEGRLSKTAEQAITLLAAGQSEKLIAHATGVSQATVNRRISELMQHFNARTRFQLGWRAALEAFPGRAVWDPRTEFLDDDT